MLWLTLVVGMAGCGDADKASRPRADGNIRLGAVLGGREDDAAFDHAREVRRFRFPEDHGAHPGFRSEWWYLTTVLEDETGREFGVQFTLFRQATRPPVAEAAPGKWRLSQVWLAHFAMTDVDGNRHVAFERWSRDHPKLAGIGLFPGESGPDTEIRAFLDDWTLVLHGEGGRLLASSGDWSAELGLTARLPVVLQGETGLSRKSPGQASYYYSWPRLAVKGTLTTDGRSHAVKGLGWFDHEWSTSVLADGQVGWAWFALHLDDGRSIMVFRLRREDGMRDPFDHGVLVQANGSHALLEAADFRLDPESGWRDPDGIEWPVAWTLHVGEEAWTVVAAINDQRMLTRIPYWEGIVHVHDATGSRSGSGYMELTGY
jgi:predicted secreted hydrolase